MNMCDDCCDSYNTFPSIIFGGGAGDYEVEVPVRSCKWAEYRIIAIANSSGGAAQVTVSGDNPPITLPYTGTLKTLTDDVFFRGEAFFVPSGATVIGNGVWERITHSQRRLFARVDSTGNGATYITAQFRAKVLTNIPAPIEQTHPDLGHQINIAREKRIKDNLERAGIPERFR
jgi:hypothetical protein